VPLLRNDRGQKRNGLYLQLEQTGKALLITSVFCKSMSILSSIRCYEGVKIIKLLSLVVRFHFISIWAIRAIRAAVFRVTDILFVDKDNSLSLQ